MRKRIYLDETFEATGEPTVRLVRPKYANQWAAETFQKTAQISNDPDHLRAVQSYLAELEKFFKTVRAVPDHSILHVIAMSGGEHYGPNKNGDAFYWEGDEGLTEHAPAYPQNAKVFKHHQNKNPELKIGDVIASFLNFPMRRVELVISVNHDRCPELPEELESGRLPPWSMGCRIAYDVCDICGNKAKSRADYCEHAKDMLKLHPDGRLNFVWNPKPHLFDISKVSRPADRIAFTLKKVARQTIIVPSAYLGEQEELLEKRSSDLGKLSEIIKVLNGSTSPDAMVGSVKNTLLKNLPPSPPLSGESLDALSKYQPQTVFSTLAKHGAALTLQEVARLVTRYEHGPGIDPPKLAMERMVALQGPLCEVVKQHPTLLDPFLKSAALDISEKWVDSVLENCLSPLIKRRAYNSSNIFQKLSSYAYPEPPGLDPLHIVNPETGQVFNTTRAAARVAQSAESKSKLAKGLGGAGLLGLGYKFLHSRPFGRVLAPLGAIAGGAGLYKWWNKPKPGYMTEEGERIPGSTPLVEKQGSTDFNLVPLLFIGRDELSHVNLPQNKTAIDSTKLANYLLEGMLEEEEIDIDLVTERLGRLYLQ